MDPLLIQLAESASTAGQEAQSRQRGSSAAAAIIDVIAPPQMPVNTLSPEPPSSSRKSSAATVSRTRAPALDFGKNLVQRIAVKEAFAVTHPPGIEPQDAPARIREFPGEPGLEDTGTADCTGGNEHNVGCVSTWAPEDRGEFPMLFHRPHRNQPDTLWSGQSRCAQSRKPPGRGLRRSWLAFSDPIEDFLKELILMPPVGFRPQPHRWGLHLLEIHSTAFRVGLDKSCDGRSRPAAGPLMNLCDEDRGRCRSTEGCQIEIGQRVVHGSGEGEPVDCYYASDRKLPPEVVP